MKGDESVRENESLGHVTESDLAGYLDNDLGPADRRRVEAHLDACVECRLELVAVQRLAASYRSSMRRIPRPVWAGLGVGAALAAVLAGLMLLPRGHTVAPPLPDTVRAPVQEAGREGRRRIDVVAPPSDTAVPGQALVFAWRATAADVYRLTVLTDSGDPVWSLETADTSAAVPTGIRLRPGAYFWRVDAIADGISATSGAHRFLVVR